MNPGADAADQVMKMTLEGIEVVARLSGAGAKNLAVYLAAVLKDQKKTKGKTRLQSMLRSGSELKVFAVKREDMQKFCQEAKRYGVLYNALHDKKSVDGYCDIIARVEDASKINRIVDRFDLATVDTASIKTEILKSREEKEQEKSSVAEKSGKEPSARETPAAKDTDAFLADLLAKPGKEPEALEKNDNPNPTMATTEKSPPSEPISGRSAPAAGGEPVQERHSVRQELTEIKEARRQAQAKEQRPPQKSRANQHKQPARKKKKSQTKGR